MAKHLPKGSRPLMDHLENRLLLAADWTYLVYIAADNNLESAGIMDVNEMEQVGSTNNVNVVMQMDRYKDPFGWAWWDDTSNGDWGNTRRGRVVKDSNTAQISTPLSSVGEVNTGNPLALADFIKWGVATYPASHYVLDVWGHGDGFTGVAWDDTSGGDHLTMTELTIALEQSPVHFDVIAFDTCLTNMLEVGYQIADYADIMVASEENIPNEGFAYNDLLSGLVNNSDWAAQQLADEMVATYGAYFTTTWQQVTLSAVDLHQVPAMTNAMNDLADAFLTTANDYLTADQARLSSDLYNADYMDIGGFLQHLSSNATDAAVLAAAQAALTQYNATILSNFSSPGLSGTGISIYLSAPSMYWAMPTDYKLLDLAIDTHWDEFVTSFCQPSPEVTLLYGGAQVLDGQLTSVDFGSPLGGSPAVTLAFTIRNDGTAPLTFSNLALPIGFSAPALGAHTLLPGQSLPFTIDLNTDLVGAFSGDVSFTTNDLSESLFTFPVTGQVLSSGEISILYNGQPLADGDVGTIDFGTFVKGDVSTPQTFTILNEGPADLCVGTLAGPAGFIVTQPLVTSLAAGQTATFTVQLDTAAAGAFIGDLALTSSDADESPFSIGVAGTMAAADYTLRSVTYDVHPYASGDSMVIRTVLDNTGMLPIAPGVKAQFQARLSTDQVWGNDDDIVIFDDDIHFPAVIAGGSTPSILRVLHISSGSVVPGMYYVGVQVNADEAMEELRLDNNTWWSPAPDVELYSQNVYTRVPSGGKVSFRDSSGDLVTVSLSGPGYVDVMTSNGRQGYRMAGEILRMYAVGTSLASTLTISPAKGSTSVTDFFASGPLKAFNARGVNLIRQAEFRGGVGQLVMGDVTGAVSIAPVAGLAVPTSVTLGMAKDFALDSAGPIKSFTAAGWLDTDAAGDLLKAPSIEKLTVGANKRRKPAAAAGAGTFMADLKLTSGSMLLPSLGLATIAGDLANCNWDLAGAMGDLTVGGTVAGSVIRSEGMGKVSLGASNGSDFLVDAGPGVGRHPANATEFVHRAGAIGSFTIRGLTGAAPSDRFFVNTCVSAPAVGAINLLNAQTDNGKLKFGLYGGLTTVRMADLASGSRWSWSDTFLGGELNDLELKNF